MQTPQSPGHVTHVSPSLQNPSPQLAHGPQSCGQEEHVSPGLHVPLPQVEQKPQSVGQVVHVSPSSQRPSPQLGQAPQSCGHEVQLSPAPHRPSPHVDESPGGVMTSKGSITSMGSITSNGEMTSGSPSGEKPSKIVTSGPESCVVVTSCPESVGGRLASTSSSSSRSVRPHPTVAVRHASERTGMSARRADRGERAKEGKRMTVSDKLPLHGEVTSSLRKPFGASVPGVRVPLQVKSASRLAVG